MAHTNIDLDEGLVTEARSAGVPPARKAPKMGALPGRTRAQTALHLS